MKKLILSSVLALIGAASASAQVLTTNEGDLIFAFRVVGLNGANPTGQGVSSNLEIDLGAATSFEGLAPGTVLNLNSTSGANPGLNVADLVSTYGANWATRSDLVFGVVGEGTAASGAALVYVGNPNNTNHPTSAPGIATLNSQVSNVYGDTTASTNSSNTGLATGDPNTPGNYTNAVRPSGSSTDYNYFSFSTENSVSRTVTPARTDLYSLSSAFGAATTNDGYFLLSSTGALSFNVPGTVAVPEPSAYALGICGVLLLLVLKRRQSVA